jgi:hypothetical protein
MSQIITWLEQHQLPCIFKKMFHFDCPGCGFQRSVIELMKGNLGASFELYPPAIPIITLFSLLIVYLCKKWKNGPKQLTYMYIFCALSIVINYMYKIFSP